MPHHKPGPMLRCTAGNRHANDRPAHRPPPITHHHCRHQRRLYRQLSLQGFNKALGQIVGHGVTNSTRSFARTFTRSRSMGSNPAAYYASQLDRLSAAFAYCSDIALTMGGKIKVGAEQKPRAFPHACFSCAFFFHFIRAFEGLDPFAWLVGGVTLLDPVRPDPTRPVNFEHFSDPTPLYPRDFENLPTRPDPPVKVMTPRKSLDFSPLPRFWRRLQPTLFLRSVAAKNGVEGRR